MMLDKDDKLSQGKMNSPSVVRHRHRHNLKNRFQLIKQLGQGTYGKVKLVVERATGKKFAVKSIQKSKIHSKNDLIRIRREIEIMSQLSHPNIIAVHEVFENSEKIILVMDHASGGELYDYINECNGLYDGEARKFFRQIVAAVQYLHQNQIVHRDLKLENIMLDENHNAIIGDFGLANIYEKNALLSTFCGSPLYASPEIMNGRPYKGPEVDCWSLGVLLYTLVYGAMPFDGKNFKKLQKQITMGDYFEPEGDNRSDAAGLVARMLNIDPNKRATIEEVCNHWWINQGYTITPNQEVPRGHPVNVPLIKHMLSYDESSGSETDLSPTGVITYHKPMKSILKQPKDFSPKFPESEPTNVNKPSRHVTQNSTSISKSLSADKGSFFSETVISNSKSEGSVSHRMPKRGILKNKPSQSMPSFSLSPTSLSMSDYFSFDQSQNPTTVISSNMFYSSTKTVSSERSHTISCNPKRCYSTSSSPKQSHSISNNLKHCYSTPNTFKQCYSSPSSPKYSLNGSSRSLSSSDQALEDYELNDIDKVLNQLSIGSDTNLSKCSSYEKQYKVYSSHSSISDSYSSLNIHDSNFEFIDNKKNDADSVSHCIVNTSSGDLIKKSILKKNGKFTKADPAWRYSIGSQSSNSSGDILNFSYDSTDQENFSNHNWALPSPNKDLIQNQTHNLNGKSYIHRIDDNCIVIEKNENLLNNNLHRQFVDNAFDLNEANEVYLIAKKICDNVPKV